MRRLMVLFLLVLAMGGAQAAGAAPAAPAATPEAVASKALAAMKADRMPEFVALMHPDALKRFRSMLLEIVDAAAREKQQGQLLKLFAGVKTVAQLKKLDATKFFLAYWNGMMRQDPELKKIMAGTRSTALGHVKEGEDTAHVVARMEMTAGGMRFSLPSVITLRKSPAGWRMLLTGDLEGAAQVLKAQVTGKMLPPGDAKPQAQVLGHVRDGENKAYIVYRGTNALGGARVTKMEAVVAERKDEDWADITSDDLERVTQALHKRLGLKE